MLAREVFNYDIEKIWALDDDAPLRLEFEDGEVIETTAADTLQRRREFVRGTRFSWYCAEFMRQYPKTPCLRSHHMDGEWFGKKTHLKLVGRQLFDCFDAYNRDLDIEQLQVLAYEITNNIYNDFTTRCRAYVTSLLATDFIDVIDHPTIREANEKVARREITIENCYDQVEDVLKNPNILIGNPVAKAAKSGSVSLGQILQCVAVRGDVTEIDGQIFRHPILTNFTAGMRQLHDLMIESRSASKALLYAKDPVADSEYFNRKLQLVTAVLSNLHGMVKAADGTVVESGDCGTTDTFEHQLSTSDLESFSGKYYVTDEGLEMLKETDRHLIGKTLQFRSVLHCRHPNPYGFCATCFGELSLSIPRGTNIGHVSTTVLCEAISQNILSTKHLDTSARSTNIAISEHDSLYLRNGSEENTIRLNKRLKGRTIHMVMAAYECPLLARINYIDHVTKLPFTRVTHLSEIQLILDRGTLDEKVVYLPVSKGNLRSSLTYDALNYIREKGWQLTKRQDYQVDLTDWDLDKALFVLPMKHASMVEYMKTIEKYFRSTKNNRQTVKKPTVKRSLKDFDNAVQALIGFYDLVSEKLSGVNIAHLETIVASAMVRDEKNFDHRLPKPFVTGQVGTYTENMAMRSLSAAMAFEKHQDHLFDVRSFTVRNRPPHPMDEILVPTPQGPSRI